MARARSADVKRFAKNHQAQRIEVEDATGVALRKNHIDLPDTFFTVAKDFKPKHSAEEQK